MNLQKIQVQACRLAMLAALLPAACAFFPSQAPPASPLIGTWTTADHNQVTFRPDAVVVLPDKGQPTTIGKADCNGVYKLAYGRMATAPLQRAFASQADLQSKLKQLLLKPEYPVADVTCDQGGTTYVLLDDRQMLAIYRDAGVGGLEHLTRL
jgi:hypothetical protein